MNVYITDHAEQDLQQKIRAGLSWIQWEKVISPGARVTIKPNFTYPYYKRGTTTTPLLLERVISILAERTPNITIVESDGGLDAWTADEAFKGHGIDKLAKLYGIRAINLSRSQTREVNIPVKGKNISMSLPKILLDNTDVFITIPVLKTHTQTGISLGLKNMWGCIPSTKRLLYHWALPEILANFATLFKPAVTIIDALWAMDGLGPMYGDIIRTNSLIITANVGAGEIAGCRAMGIDYTKIKHLNVANQFGLLPAPNTIKYNTPPEEIFSHRFKPKRDIQQILVHYGPFRSRTLTYLIYLSPLSVVKKAVMAIIGKHSIA